MAWKDKVFCDGLLCNKDQRKNKCHDCGKWICKVCSLNITSFGKDVHFCVDCFNDRVFFGKISIKDSQLIDDLKQKNKSDVICQ